MYPARLWTPNTNRWCLWATEDLCWQRRSRGCRRNLNIWYVGFGTYNNGLREFLINKFDTIFPEFCLLTEGEGGVPKAHHCGQWDASIMYSQSETRLISLWYSRRIRRKHISVLRPAVYLWFSFIDKTCGLYMVVLNISKKLKSEITNIANVDYLTFQAVIPNLFGLWHLKMKHLATPPCICLPIVTKKDEITWGSEKRNRALGGTCRFIFIFIFSIIIHLVTPKMYLAYPRRGADPHVGNHCPTVGPWCVHSFLWGPTYLQYTPTWLRSFSLLLLCFLFITQPSHSNTLNLKSPSTNF